MQGYSGTNCEKGWTDKVIGSYTCTRSSCVPGIADVGTWQSAVTRSGTSSGYTIFISNFDRSNITATATIDSFGSIHITPSGGSYGISATGSYADGKISLHFTTYSSGTMVYSCDMKMTKL